MIEGLFKKAWTKETCYPGSKDKWSEKIPEIGQCAITALIIQDLFGGDIVKNDKLHHYFNFIDMETLDFTKWQFEEADFENFDYDRMVDREELLLNDDTKQRYFKLKDNLKTLLGQEQFPMTSKALNL